MSIFKTVHFLTPSYKPVGGIIKIFDYVNHSLALALDVVVHCPVSFEPGLPLFRVEKFRELEKRIEFTESMSFSIRDNDLIFFSWPPQYKLIENNYKTRNQDAQVIHIIQNVRHANRSFLCGYATRLLSRPVSRIIINDYVYGVIEPFLANDAPSEVIPLGHDAEYFFKKREGGCNGPIKVGYTTWKSDLGDKMTSLLSMRKGFEFRAIRGDATWSELKELYHWSDVFLCTPLLEEGFYLPGLEAMAAGALVITPDSTGNRAYCEFGRNCVLVEREDLRSYSNALIEIKDSDVEKIVQMRNRGYQVVTLHSLTRERERYCRFIKALERRV